MHSVFFGGKRAHLSTLKFCRDTLRRVGLTPNRYDLLLYLHAHKGYALQAGLTRIFNVARATMSESVRALVERDLVFRVRHLGDERKFLVILTERGTELIERASNMTKKLLRPVLAKLFPVRNRLVAMHDAIKRHLFTRQCFGDTADAELIRLFNPTPYAYDHYALSAMRK